ncbi:MAG: universal stress protein [Bacteroidota bacterium]|nr:universal stress protein [Bacteroidota bacterium]
MKILLATDGSEHSNAAVEEVANRQLPTGSEVRIISVVDKVALASYAGSSAVVNDFYIQAGRHALKVAADAIEYASKLLQEKNDSVLLTTAVIDGSPKTAILEEAERYGADLIVVGSNGHGDKDVGHFMLGSVSHAVSLYAKSSVEIVRAQNKQSIIAKL